MGEERCAQSREFPISKSRYGTPAVAGGGQDHVADGGFFFSGDFCLGVLVDVYGVDDDHVIEGEDGDELASGATSGVGTLVWAGVSGAGVDGGVPYPPERAVAPAVGEAGFAKGCGVHLTEGRDDGGHVTDPRIQ